MELPINRILIGHALDRLKDLPDESVHCCVTSPPYWGLRNYGVAGQIGMERTLEEYVGRLVEVFREVRRVIRRDGTLWLNLGDSYARTGGWASNDGLDGCKRGESGRAKTNLQDGRNGQKCPPGLKEKDLCGIPWRVAFALQADGWWLRSDIVWYKRNCLPESVMDRPTRAHEFVFLLAKSQSYFYDAYAIREMLNPSICERTLKNAARYRSGNKERKLEIPTRPNDHRGSSIPWEGDWDTGRNKRSVWDIPTVPFSDELCSACGRGYERMPEHGMCRCGRSDAWVSHFAVFPEELVAPCILAGTSERGACARCGSPHKRTFEDGEGGKRVIGWRPTCQCGVPETRPCVVLDPFMGSGTTALVALKASRNFVGIEISEAYAKLAENRIAHEGAQGRLF